MASPSSYHQTRRSSGPGGSLFFLAALALAVPARSAEHPPITQFSDAETGIRTVACDAVQDQEGVMYFGSTSLLTFDGDRWRSFPISGAYAIRRLHFGPDGRLWVAAMGDVGWFQRTADRGWEYHSLRAKLPPEDSNLGDVWTVAADATGTTFVTGDRILRWNGERFVVWKFATGSKLFSQRNPNSVYVHHLESGLYEVTAAGPRRLFDERISAAGGLAWIEHRGSDWRFGTTRGFFTFDGSTLTPIAPGIVPFLSAERLSQALRLPDGRIAVGTLSGGLAFLRATGEVDSYLGQKDGLPSQSITSLFSGRDGELWVTTFSHILRIDVKGGTTLFDENAGLPLQAIRDLSVLDGTIVAGIENRVFQLSPGSDHFEPVENLGGRLNEMRGSPHGLLIAGSQGVKIWNGREVTTLYQNKSEVLAVAPALADPAEVLLADTRTIAAARPGAKPRILYRELPDTVNSLAQDTGGKIWVGTLSAGAWMGDPAPDAPLQNVSDHSGTYGLPKLIGPTIVRTNSAGGVFVFADNGAWYRPGTGSPFAPILDYSARAVGAVTEVGADGGVWIINERLAEAAPRVGQIFLRATTAVWKPYAVDQLEKIGSPRSLAVQRRADGAIELWAGGTRALLRHNGRAGVSAVPPRPPMLQAFVRTRADQVRLPIASALPFLTHSIEVELAAPEYGRRPLLHLETRIDGLNSEWRPAEAGSRLQLTGIRDGTYVVRARAVAETGLKSSETVFAFTVLPPWWRTTTALLVGLCSLPPLVYGTYRLRVRTLRRRNAELEAKVRQRTEELEAASAAKTQFVANMSHDIRNPLNGIVGLAIALEDTALSSRQREIVATMRECTTYLSSLVDDVLDFATIESGRVELRPGPFAPVELLRSISETMKSDATQSGATFVITTDPGLPPHLVGDAGRIQQIIVNFVSNALKYAGGEIGLSVRLPTEARDEVEFAVTDRGPGISPADQTRLFTKFSRLRHTRGGEEIPGAGLGLASCRLLADSMGGSVGLDSQPGCGARFFLRLPLEVTTAPVPVLTQSLMHTTVLVVEDTDYNAWAAAAVLARLGLSCERARTGQEALQLFGAKRFNVVLLDRNLPDMDGTEVARRMREMESDESQAVLLAVTAYCTPEDRALCLQSGMDAFVGKPLTPEKLRRVLIEAGRSMLTSASVHVSDAGPRPGLDTTLLSYLSDGSPQGLDVQLHRFADSLDELSRQLSADFAAREFAELGARAHQLLGHSRLVGAAALSEAASRLEVAAAADDHSGVADCLRRAAAEIQSVTEAMRRRDAGATPR